MAYERDNRGRVFTHSRDEFGDFGAFGGDNVTVGVPPGMQPWECILVPKCILPEFNYFDNLAAYFTPYFWSTFISGKYPTEVVSRWIRSLGCNPVKLLVDAPNWMLPHTHFQTGQEIGKLRDLVNPAWTLSPDLVVPGAEGRNLAIDGYQHGLCVWPPVQFRDDVHRDAWLAHHESWRYGYDGAYCGWEVPIPGAPFAGVSVRPPTCDASWSQPRNYSACAEVFPSDNCGVEQAIRNTYKQTIEDQTATVDNGEVFVTKVFDIGAKFWLARKPHRFVSLDRNYQQVQVTTLYTLTCLQMAYYMSHVQDAARKKPFPDVPSMYCGSNLNLVSFISQIALSVATANPMGLVSATMNQLSTQLKSANAGNLPFVDLWSPVAVPVSRFVDWPLTCITTKGTRDAGRLKSGAFFSPAFIAAHAAPPTVAPSTGVPLIDGPMKESTLPLLAALGLGGYLLWKYLRK